MIDENGRVYCDKCGKEHILSLKGEDYEMKWYCRHCHQFHIEMKSPLDRMKLPVILSNKQENTLII